VVRLVAVSMDLQVVPVFHLAGRVLGIFRVLIRDVLGVFFRPQTDFGRGFLGASFPVALWVGAQAGSLERGGPPARALRMPIVGSVSMLGRGSGVEFARRAGGAG